MKEPTRIKTQFRFLHAISLFASRDEIRYILNGVCLEIRNKQLLIVATDGRRIGIYKDGEANIYDAPDCSIIIPLNLINILAKVEPEEIYNDEEDCFGLPDDNVTITCDDTTVWIESWRGKIAGELIEGEFPKWKQTIPAEKNEPISARLNPSLLKDFCEAQEILMPDSEHGLSLSQGGELAPLVIQFGHDVPFIGLLMPLQNVDQYPHVSTIPDWVK